MACQGCGLNANARLCCPTCIEYGRTSFFCSQECFTKNWATHAQLHDLLKKKRALAQEEGGASGASSSSAAASAASTSGGDGASQRPRAAAAAAPAKDASSGLRGPRGPAPLPGGTSLVNNLRDPGKRPAGAHPAGAVHANKRESAAAPAGSSVLGGIMGLFSSAVRTRGPAGAEGKPSAPSGGAAAAERTEKPAGRAGTVAVAQPKASHGRNMRRFAVQATLWCLAVVSITAGGINYRESLRIEPQTSTAQLAEAAEAVAAAVGDKTPATDLGGASGSDDVKQLRSEVAALRDRLERHDKMLRYIMDRYVEKAVTESAGPSGAGSAGADTRAFEAHEASSAAAADLPAALRGATAARAGDSARKRKGGGTDESASVGLPVVEAEIPAVPDSTGGGMPATEAGPPGAKADIGAVAPEGSGAARASSEV